MHDHKDNQIKKAPSIQGRAFQTSLLIELLRECRQQGVDTLTDDDASECCGYDTRPCGEDKARGYRYLTSAMKYVEEYDGVVWERIRNADAIKCLGSREILTSCEGQRKRIHRRAKRTARKLGCVKVNDLSRDERTQHTTQLAVAGVVSMVSSTKTHKKLVAKQVREVPELQDLLAVFKK